MESAPQLPGFGASARTSKKKQPPGAGVPVAAVSGSVSVDVVVGIERADVEMVRPRVSVRVGAAVRRDSAIDRSSFVSTGSTTIAVYRERSTG